MQVTMSISMGAFEHIQRICMYMDAYVVVSKE